MVVMNNYTAAIMMSIDPLTAFAPGVLKSILFKCSNKFSDRCVLEFTNHKETATAGSSITSISSDGVGSPSPAAILSSRYISAASFMFSKASCREYPQLEQPGREGKGREGKGLMHSIAHLLPL